jgi:hypothetical protein
MSILQAVILAAWVFGVVIGIGLILVLSIEALVETVLTRRRDRL